MSTGYQIEDQNALYFVTFQVVGWIDLFTRVTYKDIVIDSLKYCQENKSLEIYAFVIMSNHIHLLIRSSNGSLSNTIREFKSYTAKEFIKVIDSDIESRREWMLQEFQHAATEHKRNSKYQIWTHENHAELIYSNKFIDQKISYIHENPVRAGIVKTESDYLYSSASDCCDIKIEYIHRRVEPLRRTRTLR